MANHLKNQVRYQAEESVLTYLEVQANMSSPKTQNLKTIRMTTIDI